MIRWIALILAEIWHEIRKSMRGSEKPATSRVHEQWSKGGNFKPMRGSEKPATRHVKSERPLPPPRKPRRPQ
jgi:hypothetical protein